MTVPRQPSRPFESAPPVRTIRWAAGWAVGALLLGGCAASSQELGRIERLPEGTLPPGREVGPPVNIQPPPPPRPAQPPRYRHRHPVPYPPLFHPYPGFGLHGGARLPGCASPLCAARAAGWTATPGGPAGGWGIGVDVLLH